MRHFRVFAMRAHCAHPKLAGLVADRDDRIRGAFHFAVIVRCHVLDAVHGSRVLDHHNGLACQVGISQLIFLPGTCIENQRKRSGTRPRHEPARNGREGEGIELN